MTINPDQTNTLSAVLKRLIPADEFPDAAEAGVGEYISRQFVRDFRDLVDCYRDGLDAVEAEAVHRFSRRFADLNAESQDDLLRRIETGEVQTTWNTPPERFFSMLVNHCAEGYYADPEQGGNRGARSWEMIGF